MSDAITFFPGAGSFGSEFRSLVDRDPGPCVVRYPGRMGKEFGVPAESFDDIVTACAEQVTGRRADHPVLFGHSFGAYVAYATASRLEEAGAEISALVVTGANAPTRLQVPNRATATPTDTAAYLNDVDPEMLADGPSDEWREIVAEIAMHDLRLLARFDAESSTKLRCPILAARGDADRLTSNEGVREWEHATHGTFSPRVFGGGHSDFLGSTACTSWFREAVDTLDGRSK
jgi:surfactin synthase thioesterase subunit